MAQPDPPPLSALLKAVLLTSLVFVLPIVAIRFGGGFEGLELAAYDAFMRQRPPEKLDDRVVIITISDDDIEQLQQYPIHDGTLADAIAKLDSDEPRAIGLDIARDVPQGPLTGRKQLAEVIEKSPTVVAGCLLSTDNHPGSPPAPGTPEGAAAFADFPTDVDKTVRRVKLVSIPAKTQKPLRKKHVCNDARPDNEILSMSFQLATMYLAASKISPDQTANNEIRLNNQVLRRLSPSFGGYAHADANDYQMMLNYRGAQKAFREFSIVDVLKNRVKPAAIRDRVVLIGYTSEVSKDELSTPYVETQGGSRTISGVIVHAHAVSQILSAVLEQRPLIQSWAEWAEWLWIWGWTVGSGIIALYNRRLGFFLIVLIGSSAVLWGICYGLFLTQGLWLPLIPTLAGVIVAALGVRLADTANRSGYAQAIYEQMREQLQSGLMGRDRQGDYLENLVRRARAVRQKEQAVALVQMESEPETFATPEMKALYEQVTAKVREELEAEQAQQTALLNIRGGGNKANRIQNLLSRARRSHSQISSTPTIPKDESPLPEDRHE
ncbi:MAG: CHASE2 domain-containing protein [Scytolyngbya sp. HA4215-MV1]|jgi:CHASE2 domain-containing sensor protein|nr:CHASE2 domain-containing protein [Scytolyngbya sp. HA4215-MV1]